MIIAAMFAMTACVREFNPDDIQPDPDGKGTGEMVFFSSGTTENQVTKATTYYMPTDYRFVCRMYYKAQAGSDDFDVSGNTDQSAWLKVKGDVGNSLYWNSNYSDVDESKKGKGGVDEYGNDYGANAFYWQNRKEHAFLAWTDMSKAKSMVGGTTAGTLTPRGTTIYQEHTGRKESIYALSGFKVVGDNTVFKPTAKGMLDDAISHYAEVFASETQRTFRESVPVSDYYTTYATEWNNIRYYYLSGQQQRHDEQTDGEGHVINYNYGPRMYYVWGESKRLEYTFETGDHVDNEPDASGKIWVRNTYEVKVAQRGEAYQAPDGYIVRGEPYDYKVQIKDEEGTVIGEKIFVYHFWAVRYSEFLYDISKEPDYSVALYRYYEWKEAEVINEYEANAFDLTKGTKTNMGQQPDILQALTIQAPVGATQESNRVNLYFKHQFSQIQVNLRSAQDQSVTINDSDIEKAELLGVTEEGYIITELMNADAQHPTAWVHKAAYKEIDFSKYTEQQLKDNPYGTSFEMFTMDAPATGYVKSYNAIAYGQLQAIRITWHEDEEGSIKHASTYKIPETKLINLESGVKYIWNIEIRRGTLAIIRTEIVDWELPEDALHNGSTGGIISE